jgi:hypothetical protein
VPPALGKSFADARAQIFFQPGEGAFKGVVVLPVRKIGDVILRTWKGSIGYATKV